MTRLTKLGHACVRIERGGDALVIDPGGFTDPSAVDGVNAVLVTHEHPDHLNQATLARVVGERVPLWAPAAVIATLPAELARWSHPVATGDRFEAAGFEVHVHGSEHAVIEEGLPVVANAGYLVEGVFHPGDSFTVPDEPVDTLLLPINAPWSKVSETTTHIAAARPRRVHPVHDGLLNDTGYAIYDPHAARRCEQVDAEYRRLAVGEAVEL